MPEMFVETFLINTLTACAHCMDWLPTVSHRLIIMLGWSGVLGKQKDKNLWFCPKWSPTVMVGDTNNNQSPGWTLFGAHINQLATMQMQKE